MKEIPKDTIICYYYGRCKNHPVKKDVIVDTMVSASSATPIDSSNQLALDTHRVEVVHQEPVNHKPSIINHIAIDTIHNNVVSLTEDSTYQTKSHSVSIEPKINVPMSYDVPMNGLVMAFTIYLTIKYAVDCVPYWQNLITDLKQELSKA